MGVAVTKMPPPTPSVLAASGVLNVNAGVLVAADGKLLDSVDNAMAVCVCLRMSAMICGWVATGKGISLCVAVGTLVGDTEADRLHAEKSRLTMHKTTNNPIVLIFIFNLLVMLQSRAYLNGILFILSVKNSNLTAYSSIGLMQARAS